LELNWSTFLLEIFNFLILVWILKRFLYKPVLDAIARRRSSIDEQLDQARQMREDADKLKADFQNRLTDWNRERQRLRNELDQELAAERSRQMTEMQNALEQARKKAQIKESRRQDELRRETEYQALQQASQFASRLLAEASSPELETRLVKRMLDDMARLTGDQVDALKTQWGKPPDSIQVVSAYPLAQDLQQQLEQRLAQISGLDVPVSYAQNTELLAGVRITIGAWTLNINLQDELKGFAEFTHEVR